jgi:pyridoxine 5-phosphate synthase
MTPRLGVNIDHVATLRQARGEVYPSIVDAATLCFNAGADQITIHLREDRRHIQDTDVEAVRLVTKRFGKPLNLEMGASPEIAEIAIAAAPDWICLVPENRQERTTEGGLNLLDEEVYGRISKVIEQLKAGIPGVKISLFLEAKSEVLERAATLSVEAVEIHTGEFAQAFINGEETSPFLKEFERAQQLLKERRLACHAGHGLTKESVQPLLESGVFEEYNIGHWIISQALFEGLGPVVQGLKRQFEQQQGNV